MKSGWILLHDIDLPGLIERALAAGQQVAHTPVHGAQHVFDFWPYEKIRSGNIGVIRITANRSLLKDFVERLHVLPVEVSPASWNKRWRQINSLLKAPRRRHWFSGSA